MADYSLAQLIEWMRSETRMSKWGMITAMDRKKLNTLLIQEYIRRFKTTSYLPPVTGSIDNGEQRFALNGFTLDQPRLSFENVDLNDSKARLRMHVVGGTQLGLKNVAGMWYPTQIREFNPLQGPVLSLNLNLADVPGTVGKEGELRLDLKHSSDFRMTVADDAVSQRLVGDYFQEKFVNLPDTQRVFPLGRVELGKNPLLEPESFAMRTQARKRTTDDPEGAVLGLVRWKGDYEGDIPGPKSDFRYLIPNDADRSATVLFDPKRVMMAQLLRSLNEIAGGVEFDIIRDDEGTPIGAKAKSGTLRMPHVDREHRFASGAWNLVLKFTVFETELKMKDVLQIELAGSRVDLKWTVQGDMAVQVTDLDSENGRLKVMLDTYGFDQTEFKRRTSDTFEYTVQSSYELEDVEGGRLKHLGLKLTEVKAAAPVIGEIKPPRVEIPDDPEYIAAAIVVGLIMAPVTIAIALVMASLFVATSDIQLPSLEGLLQEELDRDFTFAPSIKALIDDTIKLNFGNVIVGDQLRSPRDIGFFGQINPQATAFAVSPLEHIMVKASTKQFSVVPATSKLKWSVEPVLASVLSQQVGTINPDTGLYTAPSDAQFEGPFVQLRVTAASQDNGFSSSALVTVLRSPLQVNPLAIVVQAKGTVQLQAGYLGDVSKLKWSLKNPAPGGRLVGNGLTATYTPPAVMPPSDPDDPYDAGLAFIVEEVQLKEDVSGGVVRTAVVIAEAPLKTPMRVTREVDLAAGTVQLEAQGNSRPRDPAKVIWEVKYGPGSFGSTNGKPNGVYTPGEAGSYLFAVLSATYPSEDDGMFEGYVLQPLPLSRLEDAVLGTGAFQQEQSNWRADS